MKNALSLILASAWVGQGQDLPLNQEPVIAARVPSQETGEEGDHLTGNWGGFRDRLVERGIHFSTGYIADYFANVSGGLRRGGGYQGLLEASIDFDLEKLIKWEGASAYVSGLYPHGKDITGRYLGSLFPVSGIQAYDSAKLFELWFQQSFSDRVSIRLGQLAVDEEFAGTEYGSIFLNETYGWPLAIGLNAPAPAYPSAAPGARIRFDLFEHSWFQFGIYDGDPNPPDASGRPTNPHGVGINFSEGAFLIAEWGCATTQSLPGTYKVGAWMHTEDFADTRFDDAGLSLWDPSTSGNPRSHGNNWGVYFAGEKLVYREQSEDSQGLGVFTRIAGSPGNRNLIELYGELGLHYQGLLPSRDEDIAGLAVVAGQIGQNIRRAARDENFFTDSNNPIPDHEVVVEATYRVQLKPWWFVQPDLQYIIHPGGSDAISDALVVGVRSGIVF